MRSPVFPLSQLVTPSNATPPSPVEICGFTELASSLPSDELVSLLNLVFSALDEIVSEANAYKVNQWASTRASISSVHALLNEAPDIYRVHFPSPSRAPPSLNL